MSDNVKEYKKILKTHTNVLTIFSKDEKSALHILTYAEDIAKEIKGKGTIVFVNCGLNKDSKKLCKKYNANPKPRIVKHYKDGEFNKDYDRKDNAKSLLNFMLDPTGDMPWEEDITAKNVVHVESDKDFIKLTRKEKRPMLVMFYAPWCGYCKKLKPDFAAAANDLKGKAVLVGMNVDNQVSFATKQQYNITGYPTLVYFENGAMKYNYGGQMTKDGIMEWLENPSEPKKSEPEVETPWSEEAPEVLHLTDATFDETLKEHDHAIVMFYAPWCGHCKKMKPGYVSAAQKIDEQQINGKLAAVDCTQNQAICKTHDVTGYPTVKYFANGEYKFKLSVRTEDKILEFLKDPQEPPPPPPADQPWEQVSGPNVLHLTEQNFKNEIKKKKHVLVMFYAPWCGHCKNAKPEIEKAAEHFENDRKVNFAGLDCTEHKGVCEQFGVTGYPTFRYFMYGKNDFQYNGGRMANDFIKFMDNPTETNSVKPSGEPNWEDIPSGVVHLTDDNFDSYIATHSSVLVVFYAPWCGHCKAMKSSYMEAANTLLDTNNVLAALDCTKNRLTASKYDITGYPTIKYFKNGVVNQYSGPRTKQDFISFFHGRGSVEDKKPKLVWEEDKEDVVVHLDDETFDGFVKNNKDAFVLFYAPWCGHCEKMKPDFIEASKIVNNDKNIPAKMAAIDIVVNTKTQDKEYIKSYPTLKFYRNGEFVTIYTGERTKDAMIQFLKNPLAQPKEEPQLIWADENKDVVHLTDDNFDDYLKEHASVLAMFYAPWCGHCKRMKPVYSEAAKLINTENQVAGNLVAVDCTIQHAVCRKYEVRGYPTLKYFKDGKFEGAYPGQRDKDALISFMKNPIIPPPPPKEPEWKDTPSEVRHLDEQTFNEFIQAHDTLVMFYAPWCGHCKNMKPAYMEAAKQLKMAFSPFVLAAIDATQAKQLANEQGVRGYPTLKYYSNGKFVENYNKQRTVEDFLAYVKEKESQKEEPTEKFEDLPSSIEHLNANTFDDHVKSFEGVLVLFYKEKDCPKCFESQKAFMQAASRLSFIKKNSFAAVDCGENEEFCGEKNVADFPSIHFLKSGVFVEVYSGEVHPNHFISYLVRHHQKEEL